MSLPPNFSSADPIYRNIRPLDDYLAQIASLPMPSDEQIDQFCYYVMRDHSWYKGSILRGKNFIFFLNPELGPGTNGNIPLNRQDFLRSAGYLQMFGYLDYRFGLDSNMDADNIPAILQELGKVRCYPYLSNQSVAHNLIWYRNEDVVEALQGSGKEIEDVSHPDIDLIRQLFARRAAWKSILDDESRAWAREKWHAAEMLIYYERKNQPLNEYTCDKIAEYKALLNEDELANLRPRIQRVTVAKAEERLAYDMLNRQEEAKIKATINKMLVWVAEMRLRP
ncbi:hypothetical protein ACO0LL_25910 [Undibacterium sp. TC4M20W]|uniref:hypothetical protein n=1 Tax=Undibacterium sp. TC4M20W TaxID=3413052 RepID=UPI003BF17F51